jgi:hypothetical protein
MERFATGRCRSGKIASTHPSLDKLESADEFFDAMAMLSVVAIREYRRQKEPSAAHHLWKEAEILKRTLVESGDWSLQLHSIGAVTSVDIVRHAVRLLRSEFRDWR